MRSRDGFRFGPALGAPSLTAPRTCSRSVRSYRALDPRPRPSPCFAIFTRNIDRRFSGSGSRPTTSATTIRRADTLTSLRFSRARCAAFRSPHRTHPHFRRSFLRDQRSSPLEEESRELRAATVLPNRPYDAAKTPQSTTRKPPPHHDAACGRRPDPSTACGDERWTIALDCTGRVAPSKGPPLAPPAAAVRCGRGSPPHLSSSSTPS